MGEALFELPGAPEPIEPKPKASPTVRRTRRQAAMLAAGIHPLSTVLSVNLRLHPEAAPYGDRQAGGRRCGNCRFHVRNHFGFPKCAYGDGIRASRGAATDCRAWWSACVDHHWKDADA